MGFYSFDTSSILNGRRDLLPPKIFPTLWEKLEDMIRLGDIRCVDVVLEELSRRDDDAYQWARANSSLFLPLETGIQMATNRVLTRHPRLLGVGGGRNGADPLVIGLAIHRRGVVVTEETASGRVEKPRIPDVCEAMGVQCLSLIQFIAEQKWVF
ncbi:DUF4411 family protein [Streptomyces hainanensis]|uniref:DUF4411 family protein n=1 Tax=Streptomyces hainanensis TaxID=402648 RepID=UPI001A9EB2B9|nr:DUF4411 family protein [Streptomyces hainanensis]